MPNYPPLTKVVSSIWEGTIDIDDPSLTPQTLVVVPDGSETGVDAFTDLVGLQAGDRVACVTIRGENFVVSSRRYPVGNSGMPLSRYVCARTANGVVAGGYDTPPAVPSNPWSTSSTFSDPNTWSRITILKPCHIDYYCEFSGSGGGTYSEMQLRLFTSIMQATTVQGATPGGGIYQGVIGYSGLMNTGEILDVILRNTGVGTTNIVYRAWVTFTDAIAVVSQQ